MALFVQKSFGEDTDARDEKIRRRPLPTPPPNQHDLDFAREGRMHVIRTIMNKYAVAESAILKEMSE